jgi:hypothetical protein
MLAEASRISMTSSRDLTWYEATPAADWHVVRLAWVLSSLLVALDSSMLALSCRLTRAEAGLDSGPRMLGQATASQLRLRRLQQLTAALCALHPSMLNQAASLCTIAMSHENRPLEKLVHQACQANPLTSPIAWRVDSVALPQHSPLTKWTTSSGAHG